MELCNLQGDVPSVQCEGTDGAHGSSRPCHNTAVAGTANAEPTGTDTKQAEASSYLHYLHPRVIPDLLFHPYSVSGGNTLFPCSFLLSLSSKTSILPAEWHRVREHLSFYTWLPHTSSCMHLSLLSEDYTDIKRGKKSAV